MYDYINSGKRWTETIVIVISPLNALILGNQIDKLKTDIGFEAVDFRHGDHDQEMKGTYKILHCVIFVYNNNTYYMYRPLAILRF